MKRVVAAAAGLAAVATANVAAACPVCGQTTNEESQIAFIVTTAFMTFLPLLMMGAVVLWVWHRARRADAEPDERRADAESEALGDLTEAR